MTAQNLPIIVGAALCALLLLIDILVQSLRKRPIEVTWGFCWFCNSILGDDAQLSRIARHNYVPICPHCARDPRHATFLLGKEEK